MNQNLIDRVIAEFIEMIQKNIGEDVVQCRLFGSCARGDYDDYSDIDIVLLTKCDREESEQYTDVLIDIVTELAISENHRFIFSLDRKRASRLWNGEQFRRQVLQA